MTTSVGTFAWPADAPSTVALLLALLCLVWALVPRTRALRISVLPAASLLALAAGLLSFGYVLFYLKGGPRIIDATSYFLEARGFARGSLDLALPGPSGSFRGRFLLNPLLDATTAPHLGVLFPPGYPLLLSIGFLFGVPMLVGPFLAVALVLATFKLTLDLFQDSKVALLAAFLSACSATLRYHTADTMSHAWAALLFVLALLFVRKLEWYGALVSGICAGILFATRPVTGMVALLLLTVVCSRGRFEPRRWLWLLLGLVPGIALLLLHQRATTGSLFESSQLRYYALADGPPGCFRFGLGDVVGCKNEHGDFAKLYLPNGYGFFEAVHTTGRRLIMHLRDAANFEPILLAIPLALARRPYKPGAGLLGLAIATLIVAYAGFYYDGNYPGGGARMFVDVLPFEHALLAFGLTRIKLARFAPALVLAGFALHTSHDQIALAARDGGRPMFEPEVVKDAGVARGLVFVSTDHGFNLGFDPSANAQTGIVVARLRSEGHDFALWNALGRPAAYRYDLDPYGPNPVPKLVPYDVATLNPRRFEAEAEWPPLDVARGWVIARPSSCTDSGRGLQLIPTDGELSVTIEIPFIAGGRYRLLTTWLSEERSELKLALESESDRSQPWLQQSLRPERGCSAVSSAEFTAPSGVARLTVATPRSILLDRIEIVAGVSPEPE